MDCTYYMYPLSMQKGMKFPLLASFKLHTNIPSVWPSGTVGIVHIDALHCIFTQDFDDWDDVGLNTPHPPDLLHLYRDFSRHVIVKPETKDVGCGEDRIDEEDEEEEQPEAVEADLNMSIEQQRQHYVSSVTCRMIKTFKEIQ